MRQEHDSGIIFVEPDNTVSYTAVETEAALSCMYFFPY